MLAQSQRRNEMINDIVTWKCLRKMSTAELQYVVELIEGGEVDYNQPGWEAVYPTNDDILEFWHESKGEVCDE